jgi:predicted permease
MRQDAVRALRLAAARPGAWLLLVVTLALGIAAPTIALTFADAVLWHPTPFANADQLVRMRAGVSPDVLRRSPAAARWLDGLFPYNMDGATYDAGRGAEGATIVEVSPGLLEALGVAPVLGRLFSSDEFAGASPVVVVGAALGAELRATAPDAATWTIRLNGVRQTVVGVMPEGFDFPIGRIALWKPLPVGPGTRTAAVGMLKPGVHPSDPALQAAGVWPGDGKVLPFSAVSPPTLSAVTAFTGAGLLVFLIALSNAAGLQIATAVSRRGEFAVRAALGASTRQMARPILVETAISTGAAAILAMLVTTVVVPLIVRAMPYLFAFSLVRPVHFDARGFAAAAVASCLAASGVAVVSIWRLRHIEPRTAFEAHGAVGGSPTRARRLLTALAIAIAVPILSSAGLLSTSFARLTNIDPGFNADQTLQAIIELPAWRYPTEPPRREALARLREALSGVPGVAAVSVATAIPPALDHTPARDIVVEGRTVTVGSGDIAYADVDNAFFSTLRIPVAAGRTFDDRDTESSDRVAIVSRALAARLWPAESPLGRRFKPSVDAPWRTVVGVADDVTTVGTDRSRSPLAFYLPGTQASASQVANLIVRTQARSAGPLASTVEKAIHATLPDAPIIDVTTAAASFADEYGRERFVARIVSGLGLAALGLALVGTYAMFWTSVQSRRREIGIRLALGATSGRVMRDVLSDSASVAVAGLVVGMPVAVLASKTLTAWLFELSPADPATHATVAAGVLLAALAAAYGPARRAARVDPSIALRQF